MIAYISGRLVGSSPGSVIIELNGIALKLFVPTSLNANLPNLEDTVKLHTHLYWRDDGPQLFGFSEIAELELFQKLIGVSGIGPRVALAILSYASPERLLVWLVNENYSELRKIPGIGLKTAQRLVLELKEKAAEISKEIDFHAGRANVGVVEDSLTGQALEALVSLGYDSGQAAKAISDVISAAGESSLEVIIRDSLRRLARF